MTATHQQPQLQRSFSDYNEVVGVNTATATVLWQCFYWSCPEILTLLKDITEHIRSFHESVSQQILLEVVVAPSTGSHVTQST